MIQAAHVAPSWTELVPWTDKRGRFHPLRATVFSLLLLPGLWLVFRWATDMLGPRAVNAAIHSTGYTAVWLLVASLIVTPAKVLTGIQTIVVIRRMVGNAALLYALLHLVLYAVDQNWRWLTIASEILSRFYLTIGFAALLGLVVLGITSTDGWSRTLGKNWKRLHRVVYALMVLGLVHYVLQSKLDVSQALVAAGVFAWLMGWRILPAGRDRTWPWLLGLSVAAGLVTLACEWGWYRFGTKIDPWKIVLAEGDIWFGLRPAGQVLALGLIATLVSELRRLSLTPQGERLSFTVLIYAVGGLVDDAAALAMGWSIEDVTPEGVSPLGLDVVWIVLLGILGAARWKLRTTWQRHLVDAIWVACLVEHVAIVGVGRGEVGSIGAGLVIAFAVVLVTRLWTVSRGAALTLIPLAILLAIEAAWLY